MSIVNECVSRIQSEIREHLRLRSPSPDAQSASTGTGEEEKHPLPSALSKLITHAARTAARPRLALPSHLHIYHCRHRDFGKRTHWKILVSPLLALLNDVLAIAAWLNGPILPWIFGFFSLFGPTMPAYPIPANFDARPLVTAVVGSVLIFVGGYSLLGAGAFLFRQLGWGEPERQADVA